MFSINQRCLECEFKDTYSMYADTWLLEKSKTVNKSNFLAESNLYCALSQQSYPFFLDKKTKTSNYYLRLSLIWNSSEIKTEHVRKKVKTSYIKKDKTNGWVMEREYEAKLVNFNKNKTC